MAAFLGSIAFLFSVLLLAWGLLLLAQRSPEKGVLHTIAAVVLLVGGVCGITCNSYFYAKYYFAEQLETAYPGMRGSGMTGNGRMAQGGMSSGMSGDMRGQAMMDRVMQDPEMMQMMHRMMHERGMVDDNDMPMQEDADN